MNEDEVIFVFGSNEAGRHGAGAAKYAKQKYGAEQGIGIGRTGNAYAIPTKDKNLRSLPLEKILLYILDFEEYANEHLELNFKVTAIGTGLAGFTHEEIACMFSKSVSENCYFDDAWKPFLSEHKKYWGTYGK